MNRMHWLCRPVTLLAALTTLTLGACSSEDTSSSQPTDGVSTTAASQFGSSMGVSAGTVADVAGLGSGPQPGDRWSIPIGLNVCGRFLEPLIASGRVGGTDLTATDRGEIELDVTEAGAIPTLGDYSGLVDIDIQPGALSFPDTTRPAVLDSTEPETPVAGATLRDGDRCDDTEAAVQVWVYSADARSTGDGILVITEDIASVPFSEDGMAVVIAFSPESSLPTLPPSALTGG